MNYTHSIIYFNKYIDMGKLCDIIHMMKKVIVLNATDMRGRINNL